MDLPQLHASDDVLAQPTRARLFALLSELRRPAGTVELAQRLGLHPNGVRVHLERMERAGLLRRARVARRRGRPPDAWMIAPDADPGGHAPSGYQDLGRWLARAFRSQPAGLEEVEETGREIGRELAGAGGEPDLDTLMASLSALGFQPSVKARHRERVSLCLHNCPYAEAVHENQPLVCALHRGMTRGLLEVVQPDAEMSAFVPHDPDRGGCMIELRAASYAAQS